MALATNGTPGEIHLNGDLHGSNDPLQPELTPTGVTPGVYNFPNMVVGSKGLILSIEDFAADDIPCATKVSCGIVKIGSNITVDVNGVVDYITADATTSTKGIVQIGSGFAINSGILSIEYESATDIALGVVVVPVAGNLDVDGAGNISVPIANGSTVGLVQVPGSDGLVLTAGVLTFNSAIIPDATNLIPGIVQIGSNIDVAAGVISVPAATLVSKGVVQVGSNIDIASGIISNPIATPISLGVVDVGIGLLVDVVGNLTLNTSLLPDATVSSKGVVQIGSNIDVAAGIISIVDGSNTDKGVVEPGLNIDIASGIISNPLATSGSLGVVQTGNGFLVDISGNLTVDIDTFDTATVVSKGVVQIGDNIDVTFGLISAPSATNVSKGVVSPGNNIDILGSVIINPIATNTILGVIEVGSGLIVGGSGNLNVDVNTLGDATTSSKGVVQIGDNIGVASGIINAFDGSDIVKGLVQSANTDNITIVNGEVDVGPDIATLPEPAFTKVQLVDNNTRSMFFFTLNQDIDLGVNISATANLGNSYDFIFDLAGFNLTISPNYKMRGSTVPDGLTIISFVCTSVSPDEFVGIIQPNFQ